MQNILDRFNNEIKNLYTIYKFNVYGLYLIKQKWQESLITKPDLNQFVLRDDNFKYELSVSKQEFENDIQEDGQYFTKLSGVFLVSLYQLWEDKYRDEIARHRKIKKNGVMNDLFGEIRKIRQAIVHNNFGYTSELNKLKILDFVINGNKLNLNSATMSKIFLMLDAEVKSMKF
ncbi:hypothetical protein [Arenibacter algicola]|uniref:RiboL-PSP-HEPN domain-containing protein n=1 Tax=Arenibacter algicola TaxID=616991 RepID=A0A221UTF2_9FLAO|nr:hypothetical protein [Arenibacter algicola]ASO04597.1 hypothetical protein AREALGSMS7_01122 [Arenibacter algicola]